MGKTLIDVILEGVSNIVRNPLFWVFVGLGVVVAATSELSKPSASQKRRISSDERILRELPGGILELVEGPAIEQESVRRI